MAAYHSGEAISVPDLREETRFHGFVVRALEAGLAATFAFPLRGDDHLLGALDLYCDRPGALSEEWMDAAQTLADVAAAYLINAQARADLVDASEQSRKAALRDPLTGLPNRTLILQLIDHAFGNSHRSSKCCAVMFLDLDRFKAVNDNYGHHVGDELLRAVAHRLTGLLRQGDSLARLSGDEFVILCEELDNPDAASALALRLHAELARPFHLSDVELTTRASIGIAFSDSETESPEELMREADLAMYRSKRDRADRQESSVLPSRPPRKARIRIGARTVWGDRPRRTTS